MADTTKADKGIITIYRNSGNGKITINEPEKLFDAARDHVNSCPCPKGCPSCIGPPMEVGETGKEGVIKLLDYMMLVTPV